MSTASSSGHRSSGNAKAMGWQQGILPAAGNIGEKLLLLAKETAERGGIGHTANSGDGSAIHYGGEGVFPLTRGRTDISGGTDLESIAAVLRSLQ